MGKCPKQTTDWVLTVIQRQIVNSENCSYLVCEHAQETEKEKMLTAFTLIYSFFELKVEVITASRRVGSPTEN